MSIFGWETVKLWSGKEEHTCFQQVLDHQISPATQFHSQKGCANASKRAGNRAFSAL
jgi:hypothetical protein